MAEIGIIGGPGGGSLFSSGQQTERVSEARLNFTEVMERTEKALSGAAGPDSGEPPGVLPKQVHIDKTSKLYEQCRALETFLVKNLLTGMRKTVLKADLIDTGFAGELYEDMLWDEYAKVYSERANFGLADQAYLELTGQRGRKPSV
ncbi:MAG: rod-binding protein [Treponema sp.]|jgi:flagellar protein FlgJ|nr:rod-binding protein [Treponema sp.]